MHLIYDRRHQSVEPARASSPPQKRKKIHEELARQKRRRVTVSPDVVYDAEVVPLPVLPIKAEPLDEDEKEKVRLLRHNVGF